MRAPVFLSYGIFYLFENNSTLLALFEAHAASAAVIMYDMRLLDLALYGAERTGLGAQMTADTLVGEYPRPLYGLSTDYRIPGTLVDTYMALPALRVVDPRESLNHCYRIERAALCAYAAA